MLLEVKNKLREKSGMSYPLVIAVVLTALFLACMAFEFLRLRTIASGVRDALQQAVIIVAIENWDETYNGLREGYSGGYELSGENWNDNVSVGNVYGELSRLLGLHKQGSKYVKLAGPGMEFALYGLAVEVDNAPFAPGGASQNFRAESTITLEVPLSFGWEELPPMVVHLKVLSGYTPKF